MDDSASVHVLHVDDDPDVIDVTAAFLERYDDRFDVDAATSGPDGLERVRANDVDCIVSDYGMPGMDGIEFLGAVREVAPDTPFILFTGKGGEEVATEALSKGATDYLRKSGDTEQYALLADRIRNAVDRDPTAHAVETGEQ